MRVFFFLLITKLSEIIGGCVLIGLLPSLEKYHELLLDDHAKGVYIIDFCTSVAVIPAALTAIFAAVNYELTLSWSVIRKMSPVDVFLWTYYSFLSHLHFFRCRLGINLVFLHGVLLSQCPFRMDRPHPKRNIRESVQLFLYLTRMTKSLSV